MRKDYEKKIENGNAKYAKLQEEFETTKTSLAWYQKES